jgi:transposase-like protein
MYREEIITGRRERARFSPEFKDEAVRLVIESGRPIAQVALELQINDGTLGNWVARYRDEQFCQFEGPPRAAVAEANRRAGIAFARILPVIAVAPGCEENK